MNEPMNRRNFMSATTAAAIVAGTIAAPLSASTAEAPKQPIKQKRKLYRLIFTKNILFAAGKEDSGQIVWDTNRYGEMGQWLCCCETDEIEAFKLSQGNKLISKHTGNTGTRFESQLFECGLTDEKIIACREALAALLTKVGLDLSNEEQDELAKNVHFQGTFLIYH